MRHPKRELTEIDRLRPILGSTFIKNTVDEVVLAIGKDTFTRWQLAHRLGVTNVLAARMLSKIAKDLRMKSVRDMYERTSPYTFADTTAGVTTLYVMFAAFAYHNLDIEKWYHRKMEDTVVSFLFFKKREATAKRRSRKTA